MTLIEIMIVIGVGSLIVGMVVVGFSSGRNAETTRKVNQVANLARYGFDKARVTGQPHRLVVNFEEKFVGLQEGDGQMYLPATTRDGEIAEIDEGKLEDQAARDLRAERSFNQSVQAEIVRDEPAGEVSYEDVIDPYKPHPRKVPRRKPPLFQRFKDESALPDLAQRVEFGENFKIVSLQTADDLQPIDSGAASLYFFPRGQTQHAHIQIQDKEGDNEFTIKIAPLTGRVEIVDGFEDLVLPKTPGDQEDALGNRQEKRTF